MSDIAINEKGKINANSVNVRKDAGKKYDRLYYAQKGDIVKILARKNGTDKALWYQIENEDRYSTKHGWVLNDFVDPYTEQGGETGGGSTGSSNKPLFWGTVIAKGTLNCRKGPSTSNALWGRFNEGESIPIYPCSTAGWYETRWPANGSNVGYVMAEFISPDGSSGGNTEEETTYNIPMIVEADRYTTDPKATWASFRKKASTSSEKICNIDSGKTIMVTTKSGEWLPALYNGQKGYIMAKFVSGSDVYCAVSGATGEVAYNRDAAIAYAHQYTENNSGTSSYNNAKYIPVGDSPDNINKDCANFVSQCLFAGGMPMHDGWHYYYPGNISNPNVNSAWRGTNSQKKSIAARKWGERVYDIKYLKKGDLVYTYDNDANDGTFKHVTIISQDVGNSETMIVCGHTTNQKDATRKQITKDGYFHIYDTLPTKDGDYWE